MQNFLSKTTTMTPSQRASAWSLSSSSSSGAAAAAPAAESALRSSHRMIIIVLLALILIALVGHDGVNRFFNGVLKTVTHWLVDVGAALGYTTGTMLNTTSNVAANTVVTGVELTDGALNSLGNVFRDATGGNTSPELRQQLDSLMQSSEKPFLPRGLGTNGSGFVRPPGPGGHPSAPDNNSSSMRDEVNELVHGADASWDRHAPPYMRQREPRGDDQMSSRIQGGGADLYCYIGSMNGEHGCMRVQDAGQCPTDRQFSSLESCQQQHPQQHGSPSHRRLFDGGSGGDGGGRLGERL